MDPDLIQFLQTITDSVDALTVRAGAQDELLSLMWDRVQVLVDDQATLREGQRVIGLGTSFQFEGVDFPE